MQYLSIKMVCKQYATYEKANLFIFLCWNKSIFIEYYVMLTQNI